MSFFSASNFAGPLTNKTHLVTIVLVAALFGAFRWSQGRIVVENIGSAHPTAIGEPNGSYLERKVKQQPVVESSDTYSTQEVDKEADEVTPAKSLKDILAEQPSEQNPVDPSKDKKSKDDSSGTSLKDIEARLGLR